MNTVSISNVCVFSNQIPPCSLSDNNIIDSEWTVNFQKLRVGKLSTKQPKILMHGLSPLTDFNEDESDYNLQSLTIDSDRSNFIARISPTLDYKNEISQSKIKILV